MRNGGHAQRTLGTSPLNAEPCLRQARSCEEQPSGRARPTLTALFLPALLAGASCQPPGERVRYQVNSDPGFAVFAVTVRGKAIVTETVWKTVKVQAATSGKDGGFHLVTPPGSSRYRMYIAISKPGYRAWLGEARDQGNQLGPGDREGNSFRLGRTASREDELAATEGVAAFTWMRQACEDERWRAQCDAYSRHVVERKRLLASLGPARRRAPPPTRP